MVLLCLLVCWTLLLQGLFSSCGPWLLTALALLVVSVGSRAHRIRSCGERLMAVAPGSRAQVRQLRLLGSAAHGIFLDQGSKLCLLHWQEDALPLSHQGSP